MFYNGLDAHARLGLDGATGGALMNRTYEDAYELIENMEDDIYQQLVGKLNYIEASNNALSIYGGDKPLFHYINNPTEDKLQERANLNDHTSIRTDVKQVQFECTNLVKTLTKLEDQMSQLISMMGDIKRQIGIGILINTEDDPRREGKEHVKAITLRSDLIEKVPKYTKYLKEIMLRSRKIKIGEQVNIDTSCSVLISRQVPPKLKDLGSFTIPIEIGDIHFTKALCDLGYRDSGYPFHQSSMSSVQPKGVLEDVLVKVRNFIIPSYFVILKF
ncbi:gag-asp_proteas domain-containing protein [Gossypium australe]|uniref:Gag-asp_proteas domain-containing protein n=1 Tax=Gossypium australe TaxID=47621 RepID=A0A5B6WYR1_9ROSI|nr:gag-asp_proteas domain-containing protein [Gossypium australe]